MDGTLTCDCDTRLSIDESMARVVCPDCRAAYAVTITRIREPQAPGVAKR